MSLKAGRLDPNKFFLAPRVATAPSALIDEFGSLRRPVSNAERAGWLAELAKSATSAARKGRLLVQLGEFDLAAMEPDRANASFVRALQVLPPASPDRGLATYDRGLSFYLAGRYREAKATFTGLLSTNLTGYDRKTARLRLQRAESREAWRYALSQKGIPQPNRIDPLGGARSLASSLHQLGAHHAAAKAIGMVPRCGEDSTPGELADVAERLGLEALVVTGGRKGLSALPKPTVVRLGHDRFVTVLSTDSQGVSFSVSDLGRPTPTRVRVDWKRWEAMRPTSYVAMAKRGTPEAMALSVFGSPHGTSIASMRAAWMPKESEKMLMAFAQSLTPARADTLGATVRLDGLRGESAAPLPQIAYPSHTPIGGGSGPSAGDPVNLATGAEDYTPSPDLVSYNPVGPAAIFSRSYHSLSNPMPAGLGSGWSHSYNYRIVRTQGTSGYSQPVFVYPNGSQVPLTFPVYQANKPGTDQVATVPAGVSLRVVWRSITGLYEVTFADGSTWEFRELLGKNTGSLTYRFSMPCKISDREASPTVARYMTLQWNVMDTNSPDPFTGTADFNAVLTDISASNYDSLMLFNYSNGNLDAVFEPTTQTSASLSTARGVSYNYQIFASTGVTTGPTSTTGLTRVAMIVPVRAVIDGWALDPTDARYAYGYGNYGTGTAAQTVAYLKSISVPSPSSVNANKVWNGGVATAYINYNSVTGAVTSLVDANGNTSTITPEVQNNVLIRTTVQTTDTIGTIQSKCYVYWNANMLETQRTVPLGTSQLYTPSVPTYGDPQNPFFPSSETTATGQVTQFTWDRYGNLRSRTSPRGTVTTLSYDETVFPYRLTSIQEGTKTPTTIAYNPEGLVSSVTSPRPYDGVSAAGATDSTTFTYSTKKQLKTVTQPGPTGALRTTTFEYETDGAYTQPERIGQPIVVTNPTGKKTRFRYNVRGNELESIDPAGFRTTRTYDLTDAPTHQYVSTTDGAGMRLATRQTYLYLGGPQTVEFSYDNAGTTVIRTQWSDLLNEGQILRNTGRGHSATSQIDSMSRLLGVTDEKSQVSNFGHDLAGRLINIRYPAGANNIRDTLTFGYDGAGRATSRIDAQSRTTTYLYDDPGGLRSGASYSSSGTTPEDLTYTYDAYDRVSQVSNGTAIESFTYDDGDLIKTHTVTYLVPGTATQVPAQTVSYTYWPDGSRKTMTALGRTWSYTYDLAGLCTGMSVSSLGSFGYQHTDAGLVTKRTTPSGLVTDQTYFSSGTLASLTNRQSASGPILSQFTVPTTGYNGVFQLTNLTASHPSSTGLNGTIQYGYDTKDQLTSETTTRGGGITKNYGYDLAGNLGTAANFNANNQPTLAGYGFDRDGNATLYQGVAFTYNRENRLTSAGSALTCAWRPDGLRGWKSNGTLRSYFVYDGKLPIGEIDASGAVLAVTVYGPAGLETRIDGTTPRYFTYDLRGNAVQSVSSTGTVAWTATYDAYGTYSALGVVSGPFRFGARWGYYLDSEVGLYLCTHRFYDAGLGRWLTRDPIGYEGGMNLYAYCENDPIQWTDPSGLDFVRSAIAYAAMSPGHRRAAELNRELRRNRKFPLHKDFYYWVDFNDTVRLHWPDMPPVEEFMFLEAIEAVKISYHRHHIIPQEVAKYLRQRYGIEVPEFKVKLKIEARDHLKNIHHGDGGGEFNNWWKREIAKIEAKNGTVEAQDVQQLYKRARFLLRYRGINGRK